MRLRLSPLPRRFLSGCGLLALLLSACGSTPAVTASLPGASVNTGEGHVSGTIIYPPKAGQASFGSGVGSQYVALATTSVKDNGEFDVTLPADIPSGGTALPFIPVGLWNESSRSSCKGKPQQSDPAAQLRILNQGTYSVDGVVVGELTPIVQVLAGQTLPESNAGVTTISSYVHADRPTTWQGTLNCVLQLGNGRQQAATVQINYQFERGWNMIQLRSEQPYDGSLATTTAKTVALADLTWLLKPIQP